MGNDSNSLDKVPDTFGDAEVRIVYPPLNKQEEDALDAAFRTFGQFATLRGRSSDIKYFISEYRACKTPYECLSERERGKVRKLTKALTNALRIISDLEEPVLLSIERQFSNVIVPYDSDLTYHQLCEIFGNLPDTIENIIQAIKGDGAASEQQQVTELLNYLSRVRDVLKSLQRSTFQDIGDAFVNPLDYNFRATIGTFDCAVSQLEALQFALITDPKNQDSTKHPDSAMDKLIERLCCVFAEVGIPTTSASLETNLTIIFQRVGLNAGHLREYIRRMKRRRST